MDEETKKSLQELGNAINESLSDSERIAEAIDHIKEAGYDIFLVLEATIGLNKRDEFIDKEESNPQDTEPIVRTDDLGNTKIGWTSQDQKFLRALKISNKPEGK